MKLPASMLGAIRARISEAIRWREARESRPGWSRYEERKIARLMGKQDYDRETAEYVFDVFESFAEEGAAEAAGGQDGSL